MLILMRRPTETIKIGNDVELTVVDVCGNKVRLGVTAPKHIRIDREEVRARIEEEEEGQVADATPRRVARRRAR